MTFDLLAVARTYREVVGGEPRYVRYWNDDETEWVDVVSVADRPQPGVTTWATLGMSRFDTDYATADDRAIRVELIGEISSAVTTFGNMLVSCALNLVGGEYGLDVDTIYPDIVSQYEPDVSTAHMLLTDVFSFDGLAAVDGDGEVLTFLQAVPVTDAEFAFARREGVAALTTRLEEADADVLDLDRPSVVLEASVAGNAPRGLDADADADEADAAPAVVYCDRWDPLHARPRGVLDEEQARARYRDGPTFAVVFPGDDPEVPEVVLDVDAGASRVLTTFFGVAGAVEMTYLFRRRGERLFFEQVDAYQYPGDQVVADLEADLAVATPYRPANVVRHEQFWFRPDGVSRRVVDDGTQESIQSEDRQGGPVDDLWEDVPEFGDWASLAREER